MRSPILLFPAKRANRAMLTSTMRLAFETTMERPTRKQHGVTGIFGRAVKASAAAPQPLEQAFAGDFVTTAAFPVHQLPCSTIPSFPDPERFGLFSDSATSRPARS